jgi:hypothetical protein
VAQPKLAREFYRAWARAIARSRREQRSGRRWSFEFRVIDVATTHGFNSLPSNLSTAIPPDR